MSYRDFCRMTPDEFEAVCRAHRDESERLSRERWEVMRMEASIMIQPHVRQKLTPRRLLPFPWEKEEQSARVAEGMTSEERHRRAQEALKRWG